MGSTTRLRWLGFGLAFLLVSFAGPFPAPGGTGIPVESSRSAETDRRLAIRKVLQVVTRHFRDRRLSERVKDKLSTLNGKELRLIVSVSDHIDDEHQTAGNGVAFLLIAALISLS